MAVILSVAAGMSILIAVYQLYLPEKVLVPKADIKAGSIIGQNDIGHITISRKDRHPYAVSDPGRVIGKFTLETLYALEPILSQKLAADTGAVKGVFGSLGPGDTYISFKSTEARWPQGLKEGDSVSVVAFADGELPQVVGERFRVIAVSGSQPAAGQIEQIKKTISMGDNTITLALAWPQLGPLLFGKSTSKELWIMPEHPEKESGGDIFEPGRQSRIGQQGSDSNSTGKGYTKP